MGTMIGAGIFVLPGVAAQEAGPVVVVSFVIGGAIAMVNALAVSELGTAMPKAGGGYYYINRGLGPPVRLDLRNGRLDGTGVRLGVLLYRLRRLSHRVTDRHGAALPTLEFGLFAVSDIQLGPGRRPAVRRHQLHRCEGDRRRPDGDRHGPARDSHRVRCDGLPPLRLDDADHRRPRADRRGLRRDSAGNRARLRPSSATRRSRPSRRN